MGTHSKVYLHAGRIIGHNGCGGFAFYDAAKLLPFYDKLRFENAVRDLTVYAKREQGQYELHAQAKKVLSGDPSSFTVTCYPKGKGPGKKSAPPTPDAGAVTRSD